MSAKDITRIAVLSAILFIVYYLGSTLMYVSITNFVMLLYGVYVKRKNAYITIVVFCFLVMLLYGFGMWVIMYFVLFPQYILIYSALYKRCKSEYVLAFVGAFLTFICGTLIDLPFIISTGLGGHALVVRLVLGFETDLGSTLCTLFGVLFLLKPLKRAFKGMEN
ncbi:hypothetical protein ACED96_13885 [Clostridium thermobutyricum]|uniref:Uncharacterized protein n=1 Tax=Clostridium thermobutyricum DSM 4928 TaxID=1121339 RepID=A0A1V4SQW7_9CLOT|nr:hypothetical protein [Clostridium thermobutyricum]OPX46066.1 hypothetical protein CLTHE_28830 [Clostridium thermobutyricum DSM 4928]OPX46173.1 hypothetical protein CLTHE_29900 [Clostridium thermobutyricum DSM 4928]